MLTLTENATTVIKRLAAQTDDAKHAGLRIGARDGVETQLAVELAPAPEMGDAVVEDNGARVFLDETAAPTLADKVLDAHVNDDGVQFTLRTRT